MKNLNRLVAVVCYMFFSILLIGQNNQKQAPITETVPVVILTTYAEKLGVTPPIKDLPKVPVTSQLKMKELKKNRPEKRQFQGRGNSKSVIQELEHLGPDPVRQASQGVFDPLEPLLNINGLNSNATPTDPTGDIGLDYYVQGVNATTLRVYDKEGNTVDTFTGNSLWSSIGYTSGGDIIVMFDQEAERWILTEFPNNGNILLFAISETSDPTGSYTVYSWGTPSFPDYPKWAVWNNAYTVTTNENGTGQLECYVIDKEAILNGEDNASIQRLTVPGATTDAGFFVATPVNWLGANAPSRGPIFTSMHDASWGGITNDAIKFYTVDIDFANENNTSVTTTTVFTEPFDPYPCTDGPGFACAPQPTGTGLDAIPEVIMNMPVYRNFGTHESLVLNFITDASDGDNVIGIRWMEFRKNNEDEWDIYQEGTYAPDDGHHRYMAGIAMDGNGNIGMAYNISSATLSAGVRFTGRKSSDPLGEMTFEESIAIEGSGSLNSGSRFGDYSHITVDPVNEGTFWFTTEYSSNGDNRTRIVAFEILRDSFDVAPNVLLSPADSEFLSDQETITVNFKNNGLEGVNGFPVGYILDGGTPVIENLTGAIGPEGIAEHTFQVKGDFSTIGPHSLKVFSSLASDQAIENDTTVFVVNKFSKHDAGISAISLDETGCEISKEIQITVSNYGLFELGSANVHISLNGVLLETIPWLGTIASGGTATFSYILTGYNGGQNDLTVSTSDPNEMIDDYQANDSFSRAFNAILGGEEIVIEMTNDIYGSETTWDITDDSGNTIISGGPYQDDNPGQQQVDPICVNTSTCFTLTLNDSFGDGIFNGGGIEIQNGNGTVIASIAGNSFNFSANEDFCTSEGGGEQCFLSAGYAQIRETALGASDGALMITAQSGNGPFEYSIDGGTSFQDNGVFEDLSAGDYDIVVRASDDCEHSETVTLEGCALSVSVEVTNESVDGNIDGGITIVVDGADAPVSYSIDGGVSSFFTNVFNGLAAGVYDIEIIDGSDCRTSEQVTLEFDAVLPVETLHFGQKITVYPNPTDGVFKIELTGYEQESVFLPVQIFDGTGKLLMEKVLVRYNDTFTKDLSLTAYPSGVYYVKFIGENIDQMARIIKN